VNAGAANVSDSLRSVVLVGNAQLAILTAQNTFRTQSASLTRLVGTPYFVTARPVGHGRSPGGPIDSAMIMQLALAGPTIRQSRPKPLRRRRRNDRRRQPTPYRHGELELLGQRHEGALRLQLAIPTHTLARSSTCNYPIFNRFQRENNVAAAQISL
jgi:hypothetical protein